MYHHKLKCCLKYVQSGEILKDEEWDADLEIPFFGFVAEEKHPGIDAERPAGSAEKEKKSFGGSVWVASLGRLPLIIGHDEKRDEIDSCEKTDKYVEDAHRDTVPLAGRLLNVYMYEKSPGFPKGSRAMGGMLQLMVS
jgi:hypothetical protein